eukprot:TRINITY_DN99331_c0_g1_i1.p1 TRINITY_DN99331_c0_g1~~TRINITY_DN99331_c0_g1_i1.p1  ORF type:complete len:309 (-),score=51.85 TRINITY_DN99331_c0_g1_i1:121-1047(-)
MHSFKAATHLLLWGVAHGALTVGWSVIPSHTAVHGKTSLQARALRGQAACSVEPGQEKGSRPLAWVPAILAGMAAFAVVLGGAPHAARAEERSVSIYFGQGCFWHVQNVLAKEEMRLFGRTGPEVTATAGYAGGNEISVVQMPDGSSLNEVCYHNRQDVSDYGRMGHTEVVSITVPEDKVGEISKALLDDAANSFFGRHDPQDFGSEYRSAIGLPGGMSGSPFKQIEKVSDGRLQFVMGQGNDADTVGSKKIWVYDTAKYPFFQGEIYHQFHDDMLEFYPDSYHKIRTMRYQAGTLKKVSCPDVRIND